MGIFKEYLNSKGKVETGTVDVSGDRTDPMTPPNKPPKEHSSQKPYISDGKKVKGSDKGFGDMGEKEMKYDPCCDTNKGKEPAKIPTAEQSFAELELVPLITEAVSGNPKLLEKVVYDLKKNGQLGALVAEVMSHRETYNHMAEIIKNETYGPGICKRLSKTMGQIVEEVDTPFHKAADFKDDEAAEPNDDMDDDITNDLEDDMGDLDGMGDPNELGGDMGEPNELGGDMGVDGMEDMNSDIAQPMSSPLMQSSEMSKFKNSFQRSFQKHFQRKMMSQK